MAPRKRTYKTVRVCVSPERHAELKALLMPRDCSERAGWRPDSRALQYRRKGRAKTRGR